MIVFDQDQGLKAFAPDGSFVRTLARHGEGPDEARYISSMRLEAGLLAAWDQGHRWIQIWDHQFRLLHTTPVPRLSPAYDESAVSVLDNGEVWVKLAPDQSMDGRGFPRAEYMQVWPEAGDTLHVGAGGEACDRPYDTTYRSGFWQDLREPWFPSTITALGPEGEVYVGCNEGFRFLRILDGDTLEFARPDRDQVIPDPERRFFETAWTPPIGTMPRFRPEYSRIIPGGDGRVWAFETSPAQPLDMPPEIAAMSGFDTVLGPADRGGRFSVFDAQGRLIAIVPLPEDVRYSGLPTTPRLFIRGDTIWAVRTGELDEHYVARYIVPFGPGR